MSPSPRDSVSTKHCSKTCTKYTKFNYYTTPTRTDLFLSHILFLKQNNH